MFSFHFKYQLLFFLLLFYSIHLKATENTLTLKENFQKALPGDYIVVSFNKTDTLMHIYDKEYPIMTIEEITIPENSAKEQKIKWKEWIEKEAPGHSCWVMYEIDVQTGEMLRYYSFTKKGWFTIPDADNFLSKLLNLRLTKTPDRARKKIGPRPSSGPDMRAIWEPRMIVNGKVMKEVKFDAWQTQWPRDQSELSGKLIEIYLPQNSQLYPSYFPYWLQVTGAVGKAKVRIIDSGRDLKSPKPPFSHLHQLHHP
jgi:hypothetical protein